VVQVVECLPRKFQALNSNITTTTTKEKKTVTKILPGSNHLTAAHFPHYTALLHWPLQIIWHKQCRIPVKKNEAITTALKIARP
jgi:hypothetical protein